MPTPYERTLPVPARPRMMRPTRGRLLAGVCAGLADHLGVPVRWVRATFVVLTIIAGAGFAAYIFLWLLTPEGELAQAAPDGANRPALDARGAWQLAIGVVIVATGGLLAAQKRGFDVRANVVIPLLIVGAGVALAWSQLDEAQRSRWLGGSGDGPRGIAIARLGVGLALAVVGLVVLVTRGRSLAAVWDAGLATLAVLAGAVLVAAPWVVRLWTDLRTEQTAAARANERADIAAHLHDSVLQTLAMIQRSADDPVAVGSLARAQERELRSWIYAGPAPAADSLAAALETAAHAVEDEHGIPIDVVVTGDRPVEARGQVLVPAFREALLNAVRHGQPPVTAYVEIGAGGVSAYVRDHGAGFSLDDVPPDRLGVRESILGRLERAGGQATVRVLDHGTEVAMTLPPTEGEAS